VQPAGGIVDDRVAASGRRRKFGRGDCTTSGDDGNRNDTYGDPVVTTHLAPPSGDSCWPTP
jgi:hypothetical protein